MKMMRYRAGCVVAWLLCILTLTDARQNQMPATYEDDVYHCSDPTLVYVGSISCDATTWMWNINELSADAPPESCGTEQDVLSLTAEEILAADNAMEPCVLWAMFYGHLQPTAAPTSAPTETPSYPDDLYHCRDPSSIDLTESISCDDKTHLWNLDELREKAPPSMCGATFYIALEEVPNVQDWFEPCVLWAMTYGNLKPTPSPTASPTMAPTTSSPTASPTAMPTPFTTATPTTSPTEAQWINMEMNPLTISLIWSTALDDSFSLDRNELKELTQNHILESLRVDLGQDQVHAVSLKITPGVPKTYSYAQTLSGNVTVVAQSGVTASKLQAYILDAFQDNALVLYIYRLQIADDEFLSRVTSVSVGTTVDDGSSNNSLTNNNNNGGDDSDGLGVIMLTVLIGVTALVMAFLLVAYCMLCRGSSKTAKQALEKDYVQPFSAAPMSRGRDIPDIPAIPTKSSSMEDPAIPNVVDDDEEMQRSLSNFTASEIDERSHEGGEFYTDNTDEQSVGTSVYSYYNAQDDKSLAGNSVANSIFTSILDSSKNRKKGMLWSVMDTLQSHFGNDSLDLGNSAAPTNTRTDLEEGTTSSAASGILGPSVTESDVDSVHSSSLVYHDGSTDGDGTLDDHTDDGDHYNTPVKDRLEQLWLEDDAQLSKSKAPVDLQATLKKSNVASSREADDDDVSGLLPTHGLDTMYENSPLESNKVLLPGVVVESVQPIADSLIQSPQDDSKVVTQIPEDDDDVVVPLPSQLNANVPPQANDDCQSVASTQSSVSNFSENSGRRQLFDGTSSPDGSVQGQSARGRRSNWGHQSDRSVASTGAMSTDSAKYRSLLNQEDTNDAALFGVQEKSISTESVEQLEATPSEVPVPGEVEDGKVSPTAKLSSLIESFDKVWAGEMAELGGTDTSGEEQSSNVSDDPVESISVQESIFKPQLPRLSSRKPSVMAPIDLDSDEDIYVEDDDDDEEEDTVEYASDLQSGELTPPEAFESSSDPLEKSVPDSDVENSSEQEDTALVSEELDNNSEVPVASQISDEEANDGKRLDLEVLSENIEELDTELEVPQASEGETTLTSDEDYELEVTQASTEETTPTSDEDNEFEVPESCEEETTPTSVEDAGENEDLNPESLPDKKSDGEHEAVEMSLKAESFDEEVGPNMATF